MHVTLMLTVLIALALGEVPGEGLSGEPNSLWNATGVLLLMLLPGLWTWFGAARVAEQLRCAGDSLSDAAAAARWVRRGGLTLWLLSAVGTLLILGWPQLVRAHWAVADVVLLDELLLIAPVVLALVLAWWGQYPIERAARVRLERVDSAVAPRTGGASAANDPRRASPPAGPECLTRRGYVAAHVRLLILPVLLPLLAMLALRDVGLAVAPGLAESRWGAAGMIALLAVVFAGLPWLLQLAWAASSLPEGPLRRRLEALLRRAGVGDCRLLQWPTGGMMANAAVVGFVPGVRCVLLSDALLERLSDAEIEAVVAHEVAHLRAGHLWLRGAAMLLPLSAWLLLRTIAPDVALPWEVALRGADAWGLLALIGALGLYVVVVFGWYARLLEHQADWLACRLIDPRDARAGAAVYLRALANLTGGVRMSRRCRTWQHASMLSRAKVLKSLVTDTTCELRFSEQIGWLNRLLVGVALGPVAFHLLFG